MRRKGFTKTAATHGADPSHIPPPALVIHYVPMHITWQDVLKYRYAH